MRHGRGVPYAEGMDTAFSDPRVAAVFAAFPEAVHADLMALRRLIFATAARTPGVGPLDETLKWGQPAYLTSSTKAGSTIRLGVAKTGECALYVHCQTTILSEFRAIFPDIFRYDGNRAVLFDAPPDHDALAILINGALTWHLRKRGP